MEVIHALQSAASPALDRLMLYVTNLGSEQAYVVMLVIAFLSVDARVGRQLAVTFLAGFHLNQLLKGAFVTARPFELDESVLRSEAARATALGAGFPSGHAQAATTFWGFAAAAAGRTWFTWLAAAIIALVGVSRLYLGVHLPVDVVGGIVIGMAVIVVGLLAFRTRARLGRGWTIALGIAVPLALHVLLPTPESGLFMGAAAAFVTGPQFVRYEAHGAWWRRAAMGALGVAVVFAALAGTSAAVPDEIRHGVVGSFFRYLLVGYAGTVVMPLVGRVTRLAPARS